MKSAEWICTKCTTTNRAYVKSATTTVTDKCISCKARHTIKRGQTQVRWEATPTK